jgi:hypothetical protein
LSAVSYETVRRIDTAIAKYMRYEEAMARS